MTLMKTHTGHVAKKKKLTRIRKRIYYKTKRALTILMSLVTPENVEHKLFFSELAHQHKLTNENVQVIQGNAFRMLT